MRQDTELISLMQNVPKKLIAYYKKMFQYYTEGHWDKAKNGLTKILKRKEDGPSLFLMKTMEELKFIPPRKWHGVRES